MIGAQNRFRCVQERNLRQHPPEAFPVLFVGESEEIGSHGLVNVHTVIRPDGSGQAGDRWQLPVVRGHHYRQYGHLDPGLAEAAARIFEDDGLDTEPLHAAWRAARLVPRSAAEPPATAEEDLANTILGND